MEVRKEKEKGKAKITRVRELKSEILKVKDKLENVPESRRPGTGKGQGAEGFGVSSRWKPGENGSQRGPSKLRIKFWIYVVEFLDMLQEEVGSIDDETLTLGQLGAKRFALAVAEGNWARTKEVIIRELGDRSEGQDADDENKPRLIKLPFQMKIS